MNLKKLMWFTNGPATLLMLLVVMIFNAGMTDDLRASDIKAAAVEAVEGDVDLYVDAKTDPAKLRQGDMVDLWNSITTGAKSKLLLRWNDSLMISTGQFSSLLLSTQAAGSALESNVEITEGIIRVSTISQLGSPADAYAVVTPAAVIRPVSLGEPTDFVVEVYDPTTTVVTVGKGQVVVSRVGQDPATGKVVSACQNAYVEGQNKDLTVLSVANKDLTAVVGEATIANTIPANFDECDVAPRQASPPYVPDRGAISPPITTYTWQPAFEVDDTDLIDDYPYQEVRIISPPPYVGDITCFVPGIGNLIIPAVPGWTFDPELFLVYVQQIIVDRVILYDQHYWDSCALRQQELRNLIYINQLSRNYGDLWNYEQELAYLNTRLAWANRRIRRLQGRVTDLEQLLHRRLPNEPMRLQIRGQVANAFHSPTNVPFLQNFRNRLRSQETLQSQFAQLSSQQLTQFGKHVGMERDPVKRLALRHDMLRLRDQVIGGKVGLTDKYKDVGVLATRFAKEKDIQAREKLQTQMLQELQKSGRVDSTDPLSKVNVASLKQRVSSEPNPDRRRHMEQRFNQLEQSMGARQQVQTNMNNIEEVTSKAAKESNPEKRKEILGSLKDLWVPAAGAIPLGVGLMEQRRRQKEATQPQDLTKPVTPAKQILEQPHQADILRKQQEEQRRLQETTSKTDAERRINEQRKQAEEKQRLREEQKQQSEIRKRHQEEQRKLDQGPGQAEIQRRQLEDQKRHSEQVLRQQEEQRIQQEKARLLQEEQKKHQGPGQAEIQRRQLEEQKRHSEQVLRQQEEQRIQQEKARLLQEEQKKHQGPGQAEIQRRQLEDQKRHSEQEIRLREEQRKREQRTPTQLIPEEPKKHKDGAGQAEIQRRQLEEQKHRSEQEIRLREEQRKREQKATTQHLQEDQRRQQEGARQADIQRRQLEDQKRQSEQLRRQQDEQRKQQERAQRLQEDQRRQQEGARQADIQRRQLEDQRRQSEQLRRQQDEQRKQQERAQRLHEDQRRQQEGARQADIQRRRLEDQRRQSEQLRRQQEEQQRKLEEQRKR